MADSIWHPHDQGIDVNAIAGNHGGGQHPVAPVHPHPSGSVNPGLKQGLSQADDEMVWRKTSPEGQSPDAAGMPGSVTRDAYLSRKYHESKAAPGAAHSTPVTQGPRGSVGPDLKRGLTSGEDEQVWRSTTPASPDQTAGTPGSATWDNARHEQYRHSKGYQ